jgi:hypothetical protein
MGKGHQLEYSLQHQSQSNTALYNDCVQQIDSTGNQVGQDWVVFSHKCAFRIESVKESVSMKGEQMRLRVDEDMEPQRFSAPHLQIAPPPVCTVGIL